MSLNNPLPKNHKNEVIHINKLIIAVYGETKKDKEIFWQIVTAITECQFIWLGYSDKNLETFNNYDNVFSLNHEAEDLELIELANLLIILAENNCQESLVLKVLELGKDVVAFSSVLNIQAIIHKQGYLLHGKPDRETLNLFLKSYFENKYLLKSEVKNVSTPTKESESTEIQKKSNNFMDYKNLGDKLSKEEKFTEAAKAYQQAIEINPEKANLYYLLATVEEKQENLGGAIENYQKYLKLNPQDYWAYKLLGDILSKKEQFWEAEETYKQAINLNPEKPTLYYLVATAQEKQDKLEEAITNYRKYINLNPQDYHTLKRLGDIFRETGNFAEAESWYRQALEINRDSRHLYYLLASVQQKQGKIEAAIASCHQGIKIATENQDIADFWFQIGILAEHFWRLEEAYLAYIKSYCYQEREDRQNKIHSLAKQVAPNLSQLSPDEPDLGRIIGFFESQINQSSFLDDGAFWVYQLLLLVNQFQRETWLAEDSILGAKIRKIMPLTIALAEEYHRVDMAIQWLSLLVKYHSYLTQDFKIWLALNLIWYQIKLKQLSQSQLLLTLEKGTESDEFNLNSYLDKCPLWDREWLEMTTVITPNLDKETSLSLINQYFNLEQTKQISPHPIFEIQWYQSQSQTNISENSYYHPLIDFLRRSLVQPEETNPSPYFDSAWYSYKYQLSEEEIPLLHYLNNFHTGNLSPHPFFDCRYFRYQLSLPKNIEPLSCYLKSVQKYGRKWHLEGANPSPLFQRKFYLENNPDILEDIETNKTDPYYHFITVGYQENKLAHPWQSYQEFMSYYKLYPLENLKTNLNKNYVHHFNNLFPHLRMLKENQVYLDCTRTLGSQLTYQPLISIILPIYQVKPELLQETIASVKAQSYENWQLCIVDNASEVYHQEILTTLHNENQKDSRIVYQIRKEKSGICQAANDCLALATGEYIARLNPADILSPDALYEVVKSLNENQAIDILYSDEDKIDEWGVLSQPYYKPDWSPHSILSRMYVGNFVIYKASLLRQTEGFRVGFEGAENYDLLLRCSEISQKIYHIPRVLYHQRNCYELNNLISSKIAIKAVEEHLKRRNLSPNVTHISQKPCILNPRLSLSQKPTVDLLIPSRDKADILKVCLESVFLNTAYQNFKVTLIDNGSKTSAFKELVNSWYEKEPQKFSVITCDIDFNYSFLNNLAVSQTKGEYLLLLNNDIEIISKDWLEALLEYAQLPEVGAVGARLLYPDRTIQHGGVIIGMGGLADHVCKSFPEDSFGYYGNLQSVTNYAAVTAACLMVSRKKFLAVGGLNEHLKVAFNDVDFCLKLIEKGFYNVYIPNVEIIHHESKSRGIENTKSKKIRFESEILYMTHRWHKYIQNDPFYSPYLTLEKLDFSYRFH